MGQSSSCVTPFQSPSPSWCRSPQLGSPHPIDGQSTRRCVLAGASDQLHLRALLLQRGGAHRSIVFGTWRRQGMVRQTLLLYGRVVGGCCAGGSKASCCQHVERAALRDFMLLWWSWSPLSWAAESWVLCGREAAARIAAARCGWGLPSGMCSDRVPPGTDCGERVCGAARVYFAESGLASGGGRVWESCAYVTSQC